MPGRVKNLIILLLVVILAYVSYSLLQVRRSSAGRGYDEDDTETNPAVETTKTRGHQKLVADVHAAPIDARSDRCRRQRYVNVERLTATVIVDIPSTGVYLKQFHSTINSLLSGAQALVDELIVVAGGLQGSVAARLDDYLSSLDVASRLIRNAGTGQVASRMAGAKLAKSPVVVFADWSVQGTIGWLRPLIGALSVEPNAIIVPHLDDASDPAAFATTPERLLAEYIWPLSVRMIENASAVPTTHGLYRSPALRGDLFAVRRSFWNHLGGYDDELAADPAAANLELSIRAWQCGSGDVGGGSGSILMHRCSHVGVRNLREAVSVVEPNSVKHIARLWFRDWQKILMTSVGISDVSPADAAEKHDNCRSIENYFNDIAFVPMPSAEAIHFGQLRSDTDVCARAHDDGRLDLTRCWPASPHSLRSLMFELKTDGQLLTSSGQCLTVQRNSYVLLDACTSTQNAQQRWNYDGLSGRLRNPWSDFCAMHVSDPDRVLARQILMAQNCTVDMNTGRAHDNRTWPFMRWKFANP